MLLLRLLILFLAFPTFLFAAETGSSSPEWFHEASKFCMDYNFAEQKMKCQKKLAVTEFIATEALKMCAQMPLTDLKTKCFDTILNQVYRDEEIIACNTSTLSREKIKCLGELGKVYEKKKKEKKKDNELSEKHKKHLEDILEMLEDGRYKRARENIRQLLDQ